jgi:hypothetical protein
MKPLKFVSMTMQRSANYFFLLLITFMLVLASCSSSKGIFKKKNDCGCPNKKGMVGY